MRVSPDGQRIRFTVSQRETITSTIWEARADGSQPHPLLPGWRDSSAECCGQWSPDGRYFYFLSATTNSNDVFVLDDHPGLFRKASSGPVRLTAGPLQFNFVTPSSDGRRLFVHATQPRAQVVRYDVKSQQFVPVHARDLGNRLAFSPRWPVGRLCHRSGGHFVAQPRGRLGTPSTHIFSHPGHVAVLVPGRQRVFCIKVSRSGSLGAPAPSLRKAAPSEDAIFRQNRGGVDFNWSPDGNQIDFLSWTKFPPLYIEILDLKTHRVPMFPGSEGLFSPRVSPDGRYLAALSQDSGTLMLYDFHSKSGLTWLTEHGNIAYPTWSKDSKYVYFDNFLSEHPTSRASNSAVTLGRTVSSRRASPFFGTPSGTWGGLAPDNSRLYVAGPQLQEIYSLQLQLP